MTNKQVLKRNTRILRHNRVRKQIIGLAPQARLNVFRSLSHIYAQIIDDVTGKTLASASSKDLKAKTKKTDAAAEVGKLIAEKAKTAGITKVVFDRGGYRYHGRVKALADGAREAGLTF